ncbi:MAG: urease accessory protein UreE [Hyphomicrobiales bacterium]|nr:urease accessory protein UreE [Hyphomicrobiales bacterium]
MLRVTHVHAHLHGAPADRVVLAHEDRRRRRLAMKAEGGVEFLLDLPEAMAIPDGAALILEDGRQIEVVAAPESLVKITAKDGPSLTRIAWHLGNRHVPTELLGTQLRIARDHVLEEMVAGLGGIVVALEAPFEPESGAYAAGGQSATHHAHRHHGHDHTHDH